MVLGFYRADNSPVCTGQLNSYTADIDPFRRGRGQVLAICPQSVEGHDRFSADQGGFGSRCCRTSTRRSAGATASSVRWGSTGVDLRDRRRRRVRYAYRSMTSLRFRPTDALVAACAEVSRLGPILARVAPRRAGRARVVPMFVLGIDPGLSRCGYGCVEQQGRRPRAVAAGVLRTEPTSPFRGGWPSCSASCAR